MPPAKSKQTDQIIEALCAAMLVPGLRSILIFDAPPVELRKIFHTAVAIAGLYTGVKVETLTLGSRESDDDLYGTFVLRSQLDDSPLFWQPGLLADTQDNASTRLALVPDLAHLSLMGARACIAMMGESVVSLERHGQHAVLHPDVFWIAGCASADVGKISAHLLDRFAIRLNCKTTPDRVGRAAEIGRLLISEKDEIQDSYELSADLSDRLKIAATCQATLTDEAAAHVVSYLTTSGFYSMRRDLSLARLATATAQLQNQNEVTKEHVDRGAALLGLRPFAAVGAGKESQEETKPAEEPPVPPILVNEGGPTPPVPGVVDEPVIEPQPIQEFAREVENPPEVFPSLPLPAAPLTPYPEDEAAVEHEDAPLRLPARVARTEDSGNGPIVGTERATSLHDLAFVRTVFEATKYKFVRQVNSKTYSDGLVILPCDLHSYRREPVAEQILVLVLDYTSLENEGWTDAIYPYLKEAYTERAMISLIKVGSADARHELRAELIEARSLLVPELAKAFDAKPGRGTPLAHGLDLAFQALRRHLQHGRGGPYRATLVVLSDGRGNIPLEDSRRGEIAGPVLRRGFDDALAVARQISHLDYVRTVYLNPKPQQLNGMPVELAEALAAELRDIEVPVSRTV